MVNGYALYVLYIKRVEGLKNLLYSVLYCMFITFLLFFLSKIVIWKVTLAPLQAANSSFCTRNDADFPAISPLS